MDLPTEDESLNCAPFLLVEAGPSQPVTNWSPPDVVPSSGTSKTLSDAHCDAEPKRTVTFGTSEKSEVSEDSPRSLVHTEGRSVASFCRISAADTDGDVECATECRLRFFNFNMANASAFSALPELQGAPDSDGQSLEESLQAPLHDGEPVDVVFCSLPETRLFLSEWAQSYSSFCRAQHGSYDTVMSQNADLEGAKSTDSALGNWVDGLATKYSGNLKSVLAFSSSRWLHDESGVMHGRLANDSKLAGVAIPNPKKAFVGRTIADRNTGHRLILAAAHFPVHAIRDALEGPPERALDTCKTAMARCLRKVLRRASRRGLMDNKSILFLQGDLNSRTVLHGDECHDILLEVLSDNDVQLAITHNLNLPPGRWYELAEYGLAHDLPVTYKFGHDPGALYCDATAAAPHPITVGDVLLAGSHGLHCSKFSGVELYRNILRSFGPDRCSNWGIAFKDKTDFRPFRFPSCTDRVLYWCSDALADRLTIALPQDGYQANQCQGGSDHRPVWLEAVIHISPSSTPCSLPRDRYSSVRTSWSADTRTCRSCATTSTQFTDDDDVSDMLLASVCQSDAEDSDEQREMAKARTDVVQNHLISSCSSTGLLGLALTASRGRWEASSDSQQSLMGRVASNLFGPKNAPRRGPPMLTVPGADPCTRASDRSTSPMPVSFTATSQRSSWNPFRSVGCDRSAVGTSSTTMRADTSGECGQPRLQIPSSPNVFTASDEEDTARKSPEPTNFVLNCSEEVGSFRPS